MHGDVELSAVVVHTEGSSMETDDITGSEDDGEILESLGVHDDAGVVGTLGSSVEGWVDNLQGANVEFGVDLVGEVGVDDDTVDVLGINGGEGGLAELNVVVLLSLCLLDGVLGGSLGLFGRSGSWH